MGALIGFVRRGLLMCGLIFSASASAAPVDPLAELGLGAERPQLLRADFFQTKQMAALKKPLTMTGRLVVDRSLGILWLVEEPYRVVYVLGDDQIAEIGSDGQRRERTARDAPGMAQISRVFSAVLSGDSTVLRDVFHITTQGGPRRWEVELRPRNAQLAQFVSRLHLSGAQYVEEIRIIEASGDENRIRFKNTQPGTVITDSEKSLFGKKVP